MRYLSKFDKFFENNSEDIKNSIEDLLIEVIEKHDLNFKIVFRDDDIRYRFILQLEDDPSTITDEYSNKINTMYEDIVNKKTRIERFFPEYNIDISKKLVYNPMTWNRILHIIILLTPKKTNENVEYKETIEDCFTQFCDDYDLDISIDEGHLVNGSYVPGKLLPDIIEYAKKYNTEIQIKDCYRITFIPKTHRHDHNLTEFGEIWNWKESINNDFKDAIDKMNRLKGIKIDGEIPEIKPSFWTLTIYAIN